MKEAVYQFGKFLCKLKAVSKIITTFAHSIEKIHQLMSNQRYMMRGVSASKEDVHNAIKNIDKGIFPQAFCKIIPDILGGDPE